MFRALFLDPNRRRKMIDKALEFVTGELNSYLRNKFKVNEDLAVLSGLLDPDGAVPQDIQNRVAVTLILLDHETNVQSINYQRLSSDGYQQVNPPLNFNVDVLFTACFDQYPEALKFLAGTASFFQGKYVFTTQDSPNLDPSIHKLVFDILKSDYQSVYNIWGAIGAKYQPSVIYKMRLLTIDNDQFQGTQPAIQTTDTQVDLRQ